HGQLSLAGDSVGSCFCLSELADLENRMAAPPRTVVSVSVTGCSNAAVIVVPFASRARINVQTFGSGGNGGPAVARAAASGHGQPPAFATSAARFAPSTRPAGGEHPSPGEGEGGGGDRSHDSDGDRDRRAKRRRRRAESETEMAIDRLQSDVSGLTGLMEFLYGWLGALQEHLDNPSGHRGGEAGALATTSGSLSRASVPAAETMPEVAVAGDEG
ncbi:unnamed protein product, partial [Effrenium voratum]